jgi:site-specific recombinase XerD
MSMSDLPANDPLFSEEQLPPAEAPTSSQNNLNLNLNAQATLTSTLTAFEQHMREEGFAVNTVKSFASDVRLLNRYLGASTPLEQIGTAELNKFLNWLVYERGVPCSPKSYARRVTTLKVLFGWLTETGVLIINPAEAVVQMSVTSPLPTLPTAAELARVTAVAEAWHSGTTIDNQPRKADSRPLLLLQLLLQTGMKKGEVMALTLEHIERDDPLNPQILVRYKNPRLRYKERNLGITPAWLSLLDEYVAQYDIKEAIFTCTARNLEYILRDMSNEAGVEPGYVSFENLRWVCAFLDMKQGMEPTLIREKLGLSPVTWRETQAKLTRLKAQVQEREEADATSVE